MKILNLKSKTHNLKSSRGFTLLESLVAISILMIAVASPLTIAQKGLSSAFHAKDQIIASYLAQDAIEYIINWSDQNVKSVPVRDWLDDFGTSITSECDASIGSTGCIVDTTQPYTTGSLGITSCGLSPCPPLKYNSGTSIYSYDSSVTTNSPFIRSVTVTDNLGVEALITVTVSWNDKGTPTSLKFNTRIFNWKKT